MLPMKVRWLASTVLNSDKLDDWCAMQEENGLQLGGPDYKSNTSAWGFAELLSDWFQSEFSWWVMWATARSAGRLMAHCALG